MKKTRHTEEQIIGAQKAMEAGRLTGQSFLIFRPL